MKARLFIIAAVLATLALGGTANALPIGIGGVTSDPASPPEPVSVTSSVGNAAEERVAGTLQDISAHVDAPVNGEPVPSLIGPTDEPRDGVSAPVYRAFEELVTASPDEPFTVSGVVATSDAFAASGVDGGVPGVSPYGYGRLGSSAGPQLLRLVR